MHLKIFINIIVYQKCFLNVYQKKNTSILNENIPQGFTRNECPIHLYKERSTDLTEYLLYKKQNLIIQKKDFNLGFIVFINH